MSQSVYPVEIISRCTRDGVVSWQNVGQQIGCSADEARRRFDPDYRPFRSTCEAIEPAEVDENSHRSPHPKAPCMKAEILKLLRRLGPMTAASIANRLGSPCNSVRMRLSQLRAEGMVENDSNGRANGVLEWSWMLTDAGREASTRCADGDRRAA